MPEQAAYGLRVEGVNVGGALAVLGASGWPLVRVEQRIGHAGDEESWIDDRRASVRLPSGRILVDRLGGTITFVGRELLGSDRIVHPLLSEAATAFARWTGREAFHAGAFLAAERAFGVVGEHEAGKSTLVGALAAAGVPVLADDIFVAGRLRCFAGPRTVDLRPEAAARVGLDHPSVRNGTRRRLRLPPVQAEARMGGWFLLEWGDELEAELLRPAERLSPLSQARTWTANDPLTLLELAALPVWRLRRPRRLDMLEASAQMVMQLAADLSSAA